MEHKTRRPLELHVDLSQDGPEFTAARERAGRLLAAAGTEAYHAEFNRVGGEIFSAATVEEMARKIVLTLEALVLLATPGLDTAAERLDCDRLEILNRIDTVIEWAVGQRKDES